MILPPSIKNSNPTNNWGRLFLFFIIWFLSSTFFYILIVVPFYPESINKSTEGYGGKLYSDYLFLLLTQIASLLGTITTFGIINRNDKTYLLRRVTEFDFVQFFKGNIISFVIMFICLLTMLGCGIISMKFLSVADFSFSVLFFLIIAIIEEALFRGYLIKNLIEKISDRSALFLSSLIFAFVHIANPNFGWMGFVNIFLSGMLMGLLYLQTNNLSLPIGVHFAWNLMQNFFGFAVSGQKTSGAFSVEYLSTNNIFTGGEFGMEGSILLTPIIVISIVVISRKDYFKNVSSINI